MIPQKILVSRHQIEDRVAELGAAITEYYQDEPLTVIPLLQGAMIFTVDLIRKINLEDVFLDSIRVASYVNDRSSGKIDVASPLKLPIQGRHILLVDDILDTGRTLFAMQKYCENQGALSIRTCALLNKQVSMQRAIKPDWIGFDIPDLYVVGYGLDSKERYRHLPDIRVIEK